MMVLKHIGRAAYCSHVVRTFSRQSSQLLKDSEFLFSPNSASTKPTAAHDGKGLFDHLERLRPEMTGNETMEGHSRSKFATKPAESHLKNHVLLKVPGTNNYHPFHKAWLRMQCKCSHCCDPDSGQRKFSPWQHKSGLNVQRNPFASSLDILAVCDSKTEDDFVAVEFLDLNNGSTHSGKVEKALLVTFYEESTVKETEKFRKRPKPFGGPIREISFSDFHDSDQGLMQALHTIVTDGVVILKDAPKRTETIQRCLGKFGPVMETIYGIDFNVKIEHEPINIAYSTEKLDLHMDLIYYESAPGLQGLHAYQFDDSVGGGYSLLLDVFAFAETFRAKHPDMFGTLASVPATFQKIHFKRENPVYMRRCKPHIELDRTGEIVAVNWAPPFEGPLMKATPQEMDAYYQAYSTFGHELETSPFLMQFRLQEDDILVFNNRRILHGRSEIKTESSIARQLIGAYVNIDEFYKTYNVMAHKCGISPSPVRIGNTDYA